ncbi:hypothetical protein KC364_g7625, partial [Hortaea werneckii]
MATTLPAEEDEYEIPLRDQRYFGAGIKRKRIQFVPSSSTHDHQQSTSLPTTPTSSSSAADKYLSIVLKNNTTKEDFERPTSAPPTQDESTPRPPSLHAKTDNNASSTITTTIEPTPCPTCHRPIPPGQEVAHQSSLTHQIALTHSHPPSHLDRKRKGLAVLESQGWDPDSRVGLGADGNTGRLYPVQAREKKDRVGLGGTIHVEAAMGKGEKKAEKLDAGRMRERDQEGRKKAEGLRNAFYRSEEVERYLGQTSATIHMLHPYPAFFWLLMLFFLLGTLVTRIGHKAKQTLTTSSTGGAGGEGPRSAVQVLANSGVACLLIAVHTWVLRNAKGPFISSHLPIAPGPSFPNLERVLPIGVLVQYAAVAADTFSSELGILSRTSPFLITAPWRKVARGTNGGVTVEGLG